MKISIKKTIISLGATVALASVIGAVQAADLPPPAARVAAPVLTAPAPVHDWSGLYGGLHLGWGFADADYVAGVGGAFGTNNIDADGIIGGGLLGLNFQTGNIVFGIEGDISFGDINGRNGITAPPVTATDRFETDFIATIRGRAGYAWDNILLFATAGVGFADAEIKDSFQVGPSTTSKNHTGFVVGGGLDWAYSQNLSARLEYMYGNYNKKNYTVGGTPDSLEFDTHVVRAAVNFNFGWLK